MDAGSPVASTTVTVHGDSLVAGVIYRRPEFDRQKVGIRMMDATFAYAAENGYTSFDIGGGFDYKAKWAPQAGRRATFGICPDPLFRGRRMLQRLHGPTATAAPSAEAPAP
jgi:CelD/BcsL family acetyltransferase involved in cellulose biosynthesis